MASCRQGFPPRKHAAGESPGRPGLAGWSCSYAQGRLRSPEHAKEVSADISLFSSNGNFCLFSDASPASLPAENRGKVLPKARTRGIAYAVAVDCHQKALPSLASRGLIFQAGGDCFIPRTGQAWLNQPHQPYCSQSDLVSIKKGGKPSLPPSQGLARLNHPDQPHTCPNGLVQKGRRKPSLSPLRSLGR